jgi:hypothetical protein
MAVIYDRVALIGLGLIAGSMAHAMRRGGLAGEIVGTRALGRDAGHAREIGLCDRIVDTAAEAVDGADLVVLCVPVGAMGAVAAEIAPHLMAGATVTDVGSVKRDVIAAVGPHLPEACISCPATRWRDGAFGPDIGLRGAVRQPLRPFDAGRGVRRRGGRAFARLWEAAAPMSRRWTPITTILCWPSPATRRT